MDAAEATVWLKSQKMEKDLCSNYAYERLQVFFVSKDVSRHSSINILGHTEILTGPKIPEVPFLIAVYIMASPTLF